MTEFNLPLESDFEKPSREDYRLVISDAWKDIHHSRVQEWSSLGVVVAIHVAIIQLMNFLNNNPHNFNIAMVLAGVIGLIFAIIGIGITNRHRILMIEKLNWIIVAEYKLGLLIDFDQSKTLNKYGVIPLSKSMKKKLEHFKEQLNAEINGTKSKNYYGFKYIRLKSTSSLIIAFYLALILLDVFLTYYFITY